MKKILILTLVSIMSFTANAVQTGFIFRFLNDENKEGILNSLGLSSDTMFFTVYLALADYRDPIVAAFENGTFDKSAGGF